MRLIPLPKKPKYIPIDDNSGMIEIGGCYPGYGTTLGNALRRVLLSSLDGAAITSVKIKGVKHEFSSIPNVLEDVIQIILNLKQVRFKFFGEEALKATLKAKGEKKITAGMIEGSSELEIVNKDAHIATITKSSGELEMEFTIEKGIGYVPVEQQNRENKEVGVIALDAIYTPVKRVNYSISNMRVGKRTDFEKISLEIVTDGSLSPLEAFAKTTKVLVEQFSAMSKVVQNEDEDEKEKEEKAKKIEEKKKEKEEAQEGLANKEKTQEPDPKKIKIEELKSLSTRTLNVLEKGKIKTVENIVKMTEDELTSLEGMGAKGVKEVKKSIGDFGLNLKKAV